MFGNGQKKAKAASGLPSRLHHTAYVTRDMEATRHFYEDIVGLPLLSTFCESDELFGAMRTYMHTFFGLADGSALAFFQFANPADQDQFGPQMPFSPFHHIALFVDKKTQDSIAQRLKEAGFKEPEHFVLEHGYCRSVYATDPNGMIVEFTLDDDDAIKDMGKWREKAHAEMRRWLKGDHTSNNNYRREHADH